MLFRHFSVASILAILLSALLANQNESGLRVLFLSADTGGGHRASALSLAKQVRRRMSKKTDVPISCAQSLDCIIDSLNAIFQAVLMSCSTFGV